MEIEGVDRIVIGVKDMDEALEFFSRVFETDFVEMKGPLFEEAGVRLCINLDKHLELISPGYPVKDVNPPDTKTLAAWLEERGNGTLFGLALKVKDAEKAASELEKKGIRIVGKIEPEQSEFLSIANFKEIFLEEEDTLGIKIALAEWEPIE